MDKIRGSFIGEVKWIFGELLKKDVGLKYLCIFEYFWYVILGVF